MKGIRPFGWVIIILNIYFFFNFFKDYDPSAGDTANGVGIIVFFFMMAIINTVLYILFRVTAKKKRLCPACGNTIAVGITVCPFCNLDFFKNAST